MLLRDIFQRPVFCLKDEVQLLSMRVYVVLAFLFRYFEVCSWFSVYPPRDDGAQMGPFPRNMRGLQTSGPHDWCLGFGPLYQFRGSSRLCTSQENPFIIPNEDPNKNLPIIVYIPRVPKSPSIFRNSQLITVV